MKRAFAFFSVALISAGAGYAVGFRSAWEMGLMADAPVRGSIALVQLRFLEKGRTADLRTGLEADIDGGLLRWSELEGHPIAPALNVLSGQNVLPHHEKYVRRLAAYRKSHASPLSAPGVVEGMLNAAKDADPELAEELKAGQKESDAAIARMIQMYGD